MSVHRKAWSVAVGGLLVGALLLVGTTQAAVSQDTDPRWLPWFGCWEPADGLAEGTMLCIRPVAGDVGVEMLTVAAGEIVSQEMVRADGQELEMSREGCDGWERAEFSADAHRVYLRSEYTCEGDVQRTSSGLFSMASTGWVDVNAVDVENDGVAWVQRYQLASPGLVEAAGLGDIGAEWAMAVSTARRAASAPLNVGDVIDATAHVDAKAVEAWLAERRQRFPLSADKLIRMADAGVPETVIDLVIAVSYPRTFSIDQDGQADALALDESQRRGFAYPRYFDPYYLSPFGYGYSPFGYGLSAFGYGYGYGYSPYGYYQGYRPITVVVDRRPRASHGWVVNGRGYRSGGSSAGRASAGGGSYRVGATSSGGFRGSAKPRGGSSSSSRGTARTAKPRGGGGHTFR